jgi:hypothetical protein
MTIQQFIERAIEGGWREQCRLVEIGPIARAQFASFRSFEGEDVEEWEKPITEILLDPAAWKAVEKVEGWEDECLNCRVPMREHKPTRIGKVYCSQSHIHYVWRAKMHRLIDHLAEGGTIESYLETL